MRKKITLLSCFSFVFLFAPIWLISHNSKSQSDIWFSHKSGFYNDPFFLSIESDLNGDIYYTLDGSEPTQNSLKYVQPIVILDKSKEPNQYCLITGVSPELEDSYRKLLANYHGYSVPDNYIDKANIIRAVVIDENGNRSVEANAVYFIGYNMKNGYDNINIITITTDPDNLFDNQSGIYVLGNVFNKTVTDQKILGTLNWGWWPANYTQRVEIPADRDAYSEISGTPIPK